MTDLDLEREHFCDLQVTALRWQAGGRDLRIEFSYPSPGGVAPHTRSLVCHWASEVKIRFELPPNRGGYPFTTEGRCVQRTPDHWELRLEFGSEGDITLKCSAVDWIEFSE